MWKKYNSLANSQKNCEGINLVAKRSENPWLKNYRNMGLSDFANTFFVVYQSQVAFVKYFIHSQIFTFLVEK